LIYNVKANIAQNAEDVQALDDINSDSDDEENNPGIKKIKF
jgi:hypothetical protein